MAYVGIPIFRLLLIPIPPDKQTPSIASNSPGYNGGWTFLDACMQITPGQHYLELADHRHKSGSHLPRKVYSLVGNIRNVLFLYKSINCLRIPDRNARPSNGDLNCPLCQMLLQDCTRSPDRTVQRAFHSGVKAAHQALRIIGQ